MTVTLRKDVFWQPVGAEVVLFTAEDDAVFAINEAGTIILNGLSGGQSTDEIAQTLSDKYGDSVELCTAVLNDFLLRLKEAGIVEIA